MKFVDKNVSTDSTLPVFRHTVQHGVGDYQQAQCLQLLPQAQNVIDHHAVVCVHIGGMGKGIQRARGVCFQL